MGVGDGVVVGVGGTVNSSTVKMPGLLYCVVRERGQERRQEEWEGRRQGHRTGEWRGTRGDNRFLLEDYTEFSGFGTSHILTRIL